jgi:hypothetical protein
MPYAFRQYLSVVISKVGSGIAFVRRKDLLKPVIELFLQNLNDGSLHSPYSFCTRDPELPLPCIKVKQEDFKTLHAFKLRIPPCPSLAERLIYELRAFGVGVVLVCPDSELLPQPVLKDVAVIVSMSADTIPRFALERYLFRASLEEAEKTLKELKKAKMVVYFRGRLHFFRKLPKPPKELRLRPKGDRTGVTDPGVGLLRAWPILPHRSPGRPAKVVKEEQVEERPVTEVAEQKRPKVVEVKEVSEPKATEVKPRAADIEEPLKLEEEELEEIEEPVAIEVEVEKSSEPMAGSEKERAEEPGAEVEEGKVSEEEKEEMIEEEMPLAVEPEPAPKGPPIPSSPLQGVALPSGALHHIGTGSSFRRG